MKVLLTVLNAKYIHSSLALRYLQSYCQSSSEEITISEYSINHKLLDVLADIYVQKPKIIGLACYIWNIDLTLALAAMLKQVMPESIIVLGGPEVSYDPAEVLRANNAVDFVVQGEGEEVLLQLLTALQGSGEIAAISGLSWREKGQVYTNGCPQQVASLDSLPFPYSDKDLSELKEKIVYYESSRGCPFSCQYCLSSATSGVRFLSLNRVFQDLKRLIDADVRQVKFVDRTFNAKKEHYLPILQFLAKQQCRTNFHLEIAADILDEEGLAFLKDAPNNRFQMEIGIQSTYEPTLAEIQRKNNWPRIVDHVTRLRSYGNMHLHLDLIVGLPYEGYDRFGQSFNDVFRLQPHMLQIGFLKMLKGSGIRKSADRHGYEFTAYAPYEVLKNSYMSYDEIRRLHLLEDVFDHIYNSGRFTATVKWLTEMNAGDAFHLFETLTAYWENENLHRVAHSPKSIIRYIWDFCRLHYPQEAALGEQLLKFDALTGAKGTLRPDFLPWNEEQWGEEKNQFWRNDQIVRQYIEDYTFTTWRELKRLYHIEVFPAAVLAQIAQIPDDAGPDIPVLFIYTEDEVLWQVIKAADFNFGGTRFAL